MIRKPAFDVDFINPLEVRSVTGIRSSVRYHRFQLTPEVQVNVHEDGRIRIDIPGHHLLVQYLHNGMAGSNVTVRAEANDSSAEDAKVQAKAMELLQDLIEQQAGD